MLKPVYVYDEYTGRFKGHLDYLDHNGAVHTFKTFVTIKAQDGPTLETWHHEQKDAYYVTLTNVQN